MGQPPNPGTLLVDLLPDDKEFLAVEEEMQATIREHRDNGQSGGYFNRYNIIRVSFSLNLFGIVSIKLRIKYSQNNCVEINFIDPKSSKSKTLGAVRPSTSRDCWWKWPPIMRTHAISWQPIHKCHRSKGIRWASRIHWRHVWRWNLLCWAQFKEQSICVRNGRWNRLSDAQG